ncbi:hypothetical protein [Bradyrhizobium sp. ARR65]|uniref:hypothetical protein n=1 Tax=Bradyrhizobium sp. ARR65 TaxID=1040989 RepID=UPI000B24CF79
MKSKALSETIQRFSSQEWQGESFVGRTLLLFSEQGIGDALQFIRYLPMVAARGRTIVLQVRQGSSSGIVPSATLLH